MFKRCAFFFCSQGKCEGLIVLGIFISVLAETAGKAGPAKYRLLKILPARAVVRTLGEAV